MKLAYANIDYHPDNVTGGNAHVYQFIKQASIQGHEVWVWPNVLHPDGRKLPGSWFSKLVILRQCEALVFRVEDCIPQQFKLMEGWRGLVTGSPKIVWEVNTVPEYGFVLGKSESEVRKSIEGFRYFSSYCNLAVCVSDKIADYVRTKFGVKNVVTIPNGSDPDLFHPSLEFVPQMRRFRKFLNVVWMGSADLSWVDFPVLQGAAKLAWHSDLREKIMFHIIGHGMRMSSKIEVPDNVQYHGPVLYENLPRWLSGMDVGIVSYKKGPGDFSSPLKLFDYLASGLAVIATGQPQATTILSELGQQTSALNHGDAAGLVQQLRRFLDQPGLLETYKKSSRDVAVIKYRWANGVSSVIKAIETV